MVTQKVTAILKVAVWPVVVLILAMMFMLLFKSPLEVFINKWESLKMGDVEVQVKNEEEKNFLENMLEERNALIVNMKLNLDSLSQIITTLETENEKLATKLEEMATPLSRKEKKDVKHLLDEAEEKVQASRIQVESIENEVKKDYKSLSFIGSKEQFVMAGAEEKKGFDLLVKKEYGEAAQVFKKSEEYYPSIKREKEQLSAFLEKNLPILESDNLNAKKEVIRTLLNRYGQKIPEKAKIQLKTFVREQS